MYRFVLGIAALVTKLYTRHHKPRDQRVAEKKTMNNIARIVPVKSKGDGVVPTHGTAILLADGSTLGGVQRIVITGELDDVWKAEVRLLINPADFQVLLERVRFSTSDTAIPLTNDQLSMLAMVIRHEAGALFGEASKS